jgi:hypothetical protein
MNVVAILRYAICLAALLAIVLLPELWPRHSHDNDLAVASSGDAVRLMRLSHHNS